MTWNLLELLEALSASHGTLSQYVKTLEERKGEIQALLGSARSRVTVSGDVWLSGNHMSFMAVVAQFACMLPRLDLFDGNSAPDDLEDNVMRYIQQS